MRAPAILRETEAGKGFPTDRFTSFTAYEPCLCFGNLGRNQLLDGSISLSPLYPSLTSDLHVSNFFKPSSAFPLNSPFSGIDHHLSGPNNIAITQPFNVPFTPSSSLTTGEIRGLSDAHAHLTRLYTHSQEWSSNQICRAIGTGLVNSASDKIFFRNPESQSNNMAWFKKEPCLGSFSYATYHLSHEGIHLRIC